VCVCEDIISHWSEVEVQLIHKKYHKNHFKWIMIIRMKISRKLFMKIRQLFSAFTHSHTFNRFSFVTFYLSTYFSAYSINFQLWTLSLNHFDHLSFSLISLIIIRNIFSCKELQWRVIVRREKWKKSYLQIFFLFFWLTRKMINDCSNFSTFFNSFSRLYNSFK
jgi:hypothetical protein